MMQPPARKPAMLIPGTMNIQLCATYGIEKRQAYIRTDLK